jgi:DNA polymerase
MALHDSILQEFGLSPLWVRRGMASPVPDDGVVADERAGTHASGVTESPVAQRLADGGGVALDLADDTRGNGAAMVDRPDAEAPLHAGGRVQAEYTQAGRTQAGHTQAGHTQAGHAQAGRRAPDVAPPSGAARPPQAEARPTPVQSTVPSPAPSARAPTSSDTPPDDDFSWFDDLPTQSPAGASGNASAEAGNAPAEARADAPQTPSIITLDWDALSERVAGCVQCRLCEKRTKTVFGVGDRNADWMLIGEAPGENEDRQGEPFVGQAGKLLDNMLRSLTLARDANVYIANVIKCRPPGNRNPEPDEVARCEPYLQRQVALVKPKLIVALGRFAAQSLLRTDASISSLRGRVHEYEGVPVIVTYHPAYLLRSLPDKAKAWADLCLARDTWRNAGGVEASAASSSK